LSIDRLGYLTTSQIQTLHKLGSIRNAQRIISDLSPYLCTVRTSENAHFLSKKGREWIGSSKERRNTLNIDHFLVRNQFLIKYAINEVMLEHKIKIDKENTVIPDVYYRKNGKEYFLEVDRTQLMKINQEKIKLYKDLKETKRFKEFPTVVFVTLTEHRFNKIRSLLNNAKLKNEVYMTKDLL
jgi:hypothetical protein